MTIFRKYNRIANCGGALREAVGGATKLAGHKYGSIFECFDDAVRITLNSCVVGVRGKLVRMLMFPIDNRITVFCGIYIAYHRAVNLLVRFYIGNTTTSDY